MRYNTNNPVEPDGSNDPRDLSDNSGVFDLLMNTGAETAKDRLNRDRYTYQSFHNLVINAKNQVGPTVTAAKAAVNAARDEGIQDIEQSVSAVDATEALAKADMLAKAAALGDDLNNKHYTNYAEMISDPQTRDAVVAVVDGDQDQNLNGWYSWNNTTKKWVRFQDQPAMRSVVDYRVPDVITQGSRMVPLIVAGQRVLLWAEDGKIDGAGMADTVVAAARKLVPSVDASSAFVPLMVNDFGKVIAWLRQGRFEAAGLTPVEKVVPQINPTVTGFVPLIFNEKGNVIAWLRDGKFEAAGLKAAIDVAVQDGIAAQAKKNPPKVTDGSGIAAYRAKIAKALGGTGSARVIFTGDSWAEHLMETAQPLAASLYAAYGQAGTGWIGRDADEGGATSTKSQLLNGARLVKTGFTLLDMNATQCDSLDGHAASATGTTATIAITDLKTQALTWYYKDGDGTFRYSVDGGEPVVVAGQNTGARKSIQITGLSDQAHSFTFDLVGNTGTVIIYGGMATRSTPGVEFSKAGNGGSTGTQWLGIAPFVQAYAAELKPDLAVIVLGTNDRNQNIQKEPFKAGVQALVTAYQTGSPNCSVILITPTRSGTTPELGLLSDYADAMREIVSVTPNVEFIDLNGFMPPRTTSDAMGLWLDAAHLNENGGRFVTGLLMKYFLRTN